MTAESRNSEPRILVTGRAPHVWAVVPSVGGAVLNVARDRDFALHSRDPEVHQDRSCIASHRTAPRRTASHRIASWPLLDLLPSTDHNRITSQPETPPMLFNLPALTAHLEKSKKCLSRSSTLPAMAVDPSTGIYSASIPSPTGIPADPALTSHGVKQAREMGSHLATLDPPIDVVYSSPYYRCLQTITPFVELKRQQLESELGDSEATAVTIRPEYGLCEFFGAAPFDHPIPASPEKLKAIFPAYDDAYISALAPSRKGEGIDDLYRRVAGAVQSIISRCDSEGRRAVVLCTHAAVVIALGRVLTGRIPDSVDTDDFGAFTCGLSVYRRKHTGKSADQLRSRPGYIDDPDKQGTADGSGVSATEPGDMGKWDCELNSDCSFLSSGAERGWYVEIPI
ncbi:hypothetical protein AK830_g3035 [Neonectria ditissima]|uniref:Transcription factor tau 55 kDa subunit n=1 Tax=Neonectria ditissima TaxID=78410 RepID=A0A0P7BD66_9HYPO|nr:hypothetical protein AK830_g3035 [Neonectria ditissima]